MYWFAIGSYCKPITLCVGSHGPMPTFAPQLSVEQLICREAGEPGARMSSPRLRPKLNLTDIVEPALYMSLLRGGKNPLTVGGAPVPRKYSPRVSPSPVTRIKYVAGAGSPETLIDSLRPSSSGAPVAINVVPAPS